MISFTEEKIIQALASCSLEDSDISTLISKIEAKHFSIHALGMDYEKLLRLYSEGELNQFQVKKLAIAEVEYDYVLYGDMLSQAIFDVKNEYRRRMILSYLQKTNEKVNILVEKVDSEKVINQLAGELQELLLDSDSKTYAYNEEIQKEIERFYLAQPDILQGIETGDIILNKILQGYQKKDLIIIGARPSVGKTAFALFNIIEMALKGVKVGFFSLEMSKEQIMTRIFAYLSNRDSMKIRSGNFTQDEKDFAVNRVLSVGDLSIYINDEPSLTPEKMMSISKMWKSKFEVDAVFVDYLQLMTTDRKFDTRTNEVGYVSNKLKAMAKHLDIPVIALAQLSRANEKRKETRPILSDLRDSGNIEQDADVVILLHREDYQNQTKGVVSTLNVIVAKNRQGITGMVDKKYDKSTGKMYEIVTQESEGNLNKLPDYQDHNPNDIPF